MQCNIWLVITWFITNAFQHRILFTGNIDTGNQFCLCFPILELFVKL